MQNWIFIISSNDEVFRQRIKAEKWPIFNRTPNRNKLKIRDRVLFYKSGNDGHKFVGNASIATELQKDDGADFSIGLTNVNVWKKQTSIMPLLNDLIFIKNKKNWGAYLQGGLRPIDDLDYQKILADNSS